MFAASDPGRAAAVYAALGMLMLLGATVGATFSVLPHKFHILRDSAVDDDATK